MEYSADDRARLRAYLPSVVVARFGLGLDEFATRLLELATQGDVSADAITQRFVLDDLYLATACGRGDERAWQEFGSRYFTFIREFAGRSVRRTLADDVAEQVIAGLWQRRTITQYGGRSRLKTWLGAVVAHAAINVAKRDRVDAGRTAGLQPDAVDRLRIVEPAADRRDAQTLAEWVVRAIAMLPPPDRLLVRLYYEQGLTLDQIRPTLNLSKAAISRRLERTRQALRRHVEDLAHASIGAPAETIRHAVDLSRLEFDLSHLLAAGREGDDVV